MRPEEGDGNVATVNEFIHDADKFAFNVPDGVTFNWGRMKEMRDAYITRLNGIYGRLLNGSEVDLMVGSASFTGVNEVKVGDETHTADHILIAVGGKPSMPDMPGIEHCIDSNGFFELESQPKNVAVIGGGYIGVELVEYFMRLVLIPSSFSEERNRCVGSTICLWTRW